jgi:prepilin peptidase CpaA
MIVQTMFVAILLACALYDLTDLRIPNFLNVMLIALFILVVIARPSGIDLLGHGLVFLGVFAFGAVCFYLGYWGGGDVKLYAASALWMGPELIISFIFCVSVLAGIFAVCLLAVRRIISMFALNDRNRSDSNAFPKFLVVGEGIPFAVPLSISVFLLMSQFSPIVWAF